MKSLIRFPNTMFAGLLCMVCLLLTCKSKPDPSTEQGPAPVLKNAEADEPSLPDVQPPELSITAIAILKAELVNTRFRVSLKIDNPNHFPLELSSFVYKLYGNGRLWAEGTEKNILRINEKSSLSGNIFLVMNFIDMERSLLDQIVRLENVSYRFAGNVQVGTGIERLPKFNTDFDLSGYSEVLDK